MAKSQKSRENPWTPFHFCFLSLTYLEHRFFCLGLAGVGYFTCLTFTTIQLGLRRITFSPFSTFLDLLHVWTFSTFVPFSPFFYPFSAFFYPFSSFLPFTAFLPPHFPTTFAGFFLFSATSILFSAASILFLAVLSPLPWLSCAVPLVQVHFESSQWYNYLYCIQLGSDCLTRLLLTALFLLPHGSTSPSRFELFDALPRPSMVQTLTYI